MATNVKEKVLKNGTGFRQLRKLCAAVAALQDPAAKIREIQKQLGISTGQYPEDLEVWLRCLICDDVSYPPPMSEDQLVDLFSAVLDVSRKKLKRKLEAGDEGDVSDVIASHFESNSTCPPASKSLITIQEVDSALRSMNGSHDLTARADIVRNVARWCTSNDLKMFVNLLRHDLMVDADAELILSALDESAHCVYAKQHDMSQVANHLFAGSMRAKTWEDIGQITKLLPDVFGGARIHLDDSVVMKEQLKRFIVAYNGQVVAKDVEPIDFFVTNQPKSSQIQGHAVRESWLLDCIKNQTKLDHQPYLL